jgi:hypothetical protein
VPAITVAAAGAVSAGGLGFLVVLGLIVVCVLLFRSMSHRLRNVRENFPAPPAGSEPEPGEGTPATGSPVRSAPDRGPAPR